MQKSAETGSTGENLAQEYLKNKNYTILFTNWRHKRSEIDIIAQDGKVIVFVEVKTRTNLSFGNPEDFVDANKMKKMQEAAKIGKSKFPVRNILISGLGGSGIGGTILANVLRDDIAVPIIVSKEYQIPAFVNENTLVIISSYSGNTEETLSALMQAFKKEAQIVCITSGGLIKEYAETNEL